MNLIRINHYPDGHTDVLCDSVTIYPLKKEVVVKGGEQNGKIYENSTGAFVLEKENEI